jgi:hypothetical protein
MQEVVVLVLGLALGAAAGRIRSRRSRAAVVVIGTAALGTAWSRLVGEAEPFALWDMTQALVAAVAGLAVTRVAAARRT